MPARKQELIAPRRYVRRDESKKDDKSLPAGRRPKAKIVAKPPQGERKDHWPAW